MTAARVAWGLAASVALAVIAALLFAMVTRPPVISLADAAWLLALGSYAGAGALIASRQPRNGVGWTLLAVGALVAVAGLADAYAVPTRQRTRPGTRSDPGCGGRASQCRADRA